MEGIASVIDLPSGWSFAHDGNELELLDAANTVQDALLTTRFDARDQATMTRAEMRLLRQYRTGQADILGHITAHGGLLCLSCRPLGKHGDNPIYVDSPSMYAGESCDRCGRAIGEQGSRA